MASEDVTVKLGNIPERERAPKLFLQGMANRRAVSYHKYGSAFKPDHHDYLANIPVRIGKYQEDGNTEWLIDVAVYAMLEYMNPGHPLAHFRATDSSESPGSVRADGTRDYGPAPAFHRHEGD